MTVTGEDVMAYVDGELDEAGRARIDEAARHDRTLAERIAAEQALRDRLRGHFAPVADEPVPSDWIASIRAATAPTLNVVSMDEARAARMQRAPSRAPRRIWAGAALAASLVIGVMIGNRLHQPAVLVAGKTGLVASGELAQALSTQLASAQDGAPIRILGTFKRQTGDTCRVFAGPAASGIACRDGRNWQMQQLVPGAKPEQGAYRQAGSEQADLMAKAQAMMAGDPYDAAQEKAARDHMWH